MSRIAKKMHPEDLECGGRFYQNRLKLEAIAYELGSQDVRVVPFFYLDSSSPDGWPYLEMMDFGIKLSTDDGVVFRLKASQQKEAVSFTESDLSEAHKYIKEVYSERKRIA